MKLKIGDKVTITGRIVHVDESDSTYQVESEAFCFGSKSVWVCEDSLELKEQIKDSLDDSFDEAVVKAATEWYIGTKKAPKYLKGYEVALLECDAGQIGVNS